MLGYKSTENTARTKCVHQPIGTCYLYLSWHLDAYPTWQFNFGDDHGGKRSVGVRWAQEGRHMTGWYGRKHLNLSLKFSTHFAHQISYLKDTFKYLFGSTDGWMMSYEQDETGTNLEEKTLTDRVWQNNLNRGIDL